MCVHVCAPRQDFDTVCILSSAGRVCVCVWGGGVVESTAEKYELVWDIVNVKREITIQSGISLMYSREIRANLGYR